MGRQWEQVASELVRTRFHALVGYATMLTGSRADAEDVVNDALIATFGRRRSLENVTVAETYVRRAIATTYLDSVRRSGRQNALARRVAEHATDTLPGPELEIVQRSEIDEALTHLTPQERACVVLRVMDQNSTRETAQALGRAEGSVKRYLHDGMAKLSAALAVELPVDEPERVTVRVARRAEA